MVTFIAPGQPPEAETMTVEFGGDALALTLDDGGRLELSWEALRQAVDGEQAPAGRAAA